MFNILTVEVGLGFSKRKYLQELSSTSSSEYHVTFVPKLPEPSQEEDIETGLTTLKQIITEQKPNLIIAGSRGGKYAFHLMNQLPAEIKPAFLLISAMSTTGFIPENTVVIMVHGTNDVTIPIQSVRLVATTGTSSLVKLVELENEDHSAESVTFEQSPYNLKNLIEEAKELLKKQNQTSPLSTSAPLAPPPPPAATLPQQPSNKQNKNPGAARGNLLAEIRTFKKK